MKPAFVDSDYGYVSYENIVDSWGYDVIDWVVTGSYQGDHVVLLGDGDRRAVVIIGYGSCSGCDHLESISPYGYGDEDKDWSEVIQFSEDMKKGIEWKNSPEEFAADLNAWLSEKDANDWYSFDDEIRQAVRGFLDRLSA